MKVLFAFLAVGVMMVAACMAAPGQPPAVPAPPSVSAASASAPPAQATVLVADAGSDATVAPVAAPAPASTLPAYKAGDFRLFYPSGNLTIGTPATEDGGAGSVARFHDGQENVCMQGCVSIARQAVQQAAQNRSGTFTDEAAWQQDVLACIRHDCIEKKGTSWPPEQK
jgi:hypothetical protein